MTCTDGEKDVLTEQISSLIELIVIAEAKLEAIQAALEELTRSTVAIVTAPLGPVTTAAPRMRMRGLMKQLNFKM